jgi:predicted ATPase
MLHSVLLDGFRSFDRATTLRFAPLTVLAGPNNAGKSSVIQALLALVQSEQANSGDALLLSGPWCDLGRFDQIVSTSLRAEERGFSIGLTGDTSEGCAVDTLWQFGLPDLGGAEEDDMPLERAPILELEYSLADTSGRIERAATGLGWFGTPPPSRDEPHVLRRVALFSHPGNFIVRNVVPEQGRYYEPPSSWDGGPLVISPLAAWRTQYIGPFRSPPQPLYTPRTSPIGPPFGRYAEHTAEVLFRHRTQRTDITVPGQQGGNAEQPLLSAVNAWWSYLFDGSFALQIDAPARLGFTLAIDTPSAERLGLGQVGLGLSQALPIVAACLISRPGDLLLIETPEAHLHPGAQHRLTDLFIELARKGRQVVIETHSEHLVTAAQLAVKAGFPREDVAVTFFRQDNGRTVVEEVELTPQGRALRWPPGFFDQSAIALAELLR